MYNFLTYKRKYRMKNNMYKIIIKHHQFLYHLQNKINKNYQNNKLNLKFIYHNNIINHHINISD